MPLFRRRPLLRAAAVGGGAYMAGKHRGAAQAEEQAYQPAYAPPPPPPPPPAAAPASAGPSSNDIARLQELGKLHEQGILTDDEFASQKAQILGAA
jgi:Short C-terminal domain